MTRRLRTTLFLALVAALAPRGAAGFELEDGKIELTVSGEAAYGRTDGNTYLGGTKEGSYDNTMLAVAISGQLSRQLRVVGRFDFETGEGSEIDWAFAEWKFSDALRFRAGQGKHAFGNYGEILEEGTLRPFYYAPQSIYGKANIVGEGYKGLGLTGFLRLGGWGLSYDVYGGDLDVETSPALVRVLDANVDPAEELVIFTSDLIGARVSLDAPIDGLTLRLSGYTGRQEGIAGLADDIRHSAGALSAEYLTEALTLRAEYAYSVEREFSSTNAAYVEAAWKLPAGLQLAGRLEGSWTKLDGFTGSSSNLRHREAAVAVNYWFAPEFVLKAEYHLVDGNRFAYAPFPEEGVVPTPVPEPSETTHLFVLGAQFSL